MIILPAIDIREGKCVRLKQGAKEAMTVYHDNPVDMALYLEAEGAQYLHVVDLDGAFDGKGTHSKIIARMIQAVSIPVEVGGGIRNREAVAAYESVGARRMIIGSAAVETPELMSQLTAEFGDKIAVSVDARDGIVATRGWVESGGIDALTFIDDMKKRGVSTFIYTDIARDGMLLGPNIEELQAVQDLGQINLIASGGVSSISDLTAIKSLGIYGAITGMALYEGHISMAEIRALQEA